MTDRLTLEISDQSIHKLQIAIRTAVAEAFHALAPRETDSSSNGLPEMATARGVTTALVGAAGTAFMGGGNGGVVAQSTAAAAAPEPVAELIPPGAQPAGTTGPQMPIQQLVETARVSAKTAKALADRGIVRLGQLSSLGPAGLRALPGVAATPAANLERIMAEQGVNYIENTLAPEPQQQLAAPTGGFVNGAVKAAAPAASMGAAFGQPVGQPAANPFAAGFKAPGVAAPPPAPTVSRGDVVYVDRMAAPMLVWDIMPNGKLMVTRDGTEATSLQIDPANVVGHGLSDQDATIAQPANAMVMALGRLIVAVTGGPDAVMPILHQAFAPAEFDPSATYRPDQVSTFLAGAQQALHGALNGARG